MGADQDYGPGKIALRQNLLKLQSALTGKADVEDDATGLFGIVCSYEILNRAVYLSGEPDGLEEAL
ncbi:hypothetical protein D3C71_1871570 [compost metagenome]